MKDLIQDNKQKLDTSIYTQSILDFGIVVKVIMNSSWDLDMVLRFASKRRGYLCLAEYTKKIMN